jgi:hypothetical protein
MFKSNKPYIAIIAVLVIALSYSFNSNSFQGSFITSSCDLTGQELIDACEGIKDGLPDLVITEVNPVEGNEFYDYEVVVENQGNGDMESSESTTFKTYIEGVDVGHTGFVYLNGTDGIGTAGGNDQYLIDLSGSTSGLTEETLEICINTTQIMESDTTNNCYSGFLNEVPGTPDIIIMDIAPYVDSTGNHNFEIFLTNQGDGDIPSHQSSDVQVSVDGVTITTEPLYISNSSDFASAGSTGSYTFQITEGGNHDVNACIRTTSTLNESDYTNNCYEENLDIPTADLVVSSIIEDGTDFVATFSNGGANSMSTSVNVIATLDGVEAYSFIITPLDMDSGESYEKKLKLDSIVPGLQDLEVCIDTDSEVYEEDESNNCYITSIFTPGPDLKIGGVTNSGIKGDYEIEILNVGLEEVDSSISPELTIYLDTMKAPFDSFGIVSGSLDIFTPGSSDIFHTKLDFEKERSIRICIDDTDLVAESDEMNNCYETIIPAS